MKKGVLIQIRPETQGAGFRLFSYDQDYRTWVINRHVFDTEAEAMLYTTKNKAHLISLHEITEEQAQKATKEVKLYNDFTTLFIPR